MSGWREDLAIGVRLAVGGGRTSMARFALSAFGVGIAVVVLLLAASVGTILDNRDARGAAASAVQEPVLGVDPTHQVRHSTKFRGESIQVQLFRATGPTSPVPPGLPRMPTTGEMYLSPAMADLLAAPGSDLLRPRFPQQVAGLLSPSVVADPYDLVVYTGLPGGEKVDYVTEVYAFGMQGDDRVLQPDLLLLILLGVVALLVPVFIFIAASTRIAGAERDRRLSALRLVGAGGRQVRRIAAAETLVSALAGLVLGALGYLLLRPVAASVRLLGVGVYPSDVVPNWWLVGVIAVGVPVLAVVTAQSAMRRTIIEPLGVVRFSRPVRRRVLWRLALVGAGAGLLLWNGGGRGGDLWAYSIAAGATLMLVGVPLLLPVVVERSVTRLRGGPPSWQLAVRRLQLDSGTSARVIGGVAVVLAGATALQAVLLSQASSIGLAAREVVQSEPVARMMADPEESAEVARVVEGTDGVRSIAAFTSAELAKDPSGGDFLSAYVASCADIELSYRVVDCADGEVFVTPSTNLAEQGFAAGQRLSSIAWANGAEAPHTIGEWTIPADLRQLPAQDLPDNKWGVIATPGAAVPVGPEAVTFLEASLDPAKPDAIELLRNATFANLSVEVYLANEMSDRTEEQETFLTIRRALFIGAVFTLMLAGVSLLVLAVEHIRERRRPLAVLAASGVPTGSIARSLVWQIGVPIGLGVVVAIGTGLVLAALITRLSSAPLRIDWNGVLTMSGAAVVLGLLVCLLTLPFLRSATRVESLRTE
ncbi:FtsX-like permease family protein [Actinokineospora sp. 24-640]